jgi:hypothetical protein
VRLLFRVRAPVPRAGGAFCLALVDFLKPVKDPGHALRATNKVEHPFYPVELVTIKHKLVTAHPPGATAEIWGMPYTVTGFDYHAMMDAINEDIPTDDD